METVHNTKITLVHKHGHFIPKCSSGYVMELLVLVVTCCGSV